MKMKKFIPFLLFATALFAEEAATKPAETTEVAAPTDISKISEAFGHLIGKNIESLGFKFDIAQLIKGLQDATLGKQSPMTEVECVKAISDAQEAIYKEQAKENLAKAENFLAKNQKEKDVVSTENNKLQYRIDKAGEGAVVEEHASPLIRYVGKFIDGNSFDSSKEDAVISLDETIPGFTKGLLGMKEGEKRTLFIHPDLAYGTSGHLPPNSLITFEVEVVKANAPQSEPLDSFSSTHAKEKINPEVATPLDEQKAIR